MLIILIQSLPRYTQKHYTACSSLNEDGNTPETLSFTKLGTDYIVEAFRLAQKYASYRVIFTNDYNIEEPRKRKGAIELIKNTSCWCSHRWCRHPRALESLQHSFERYRRKY